MFCENCGKKVEEGSKFCENCGTPVKAAAAGAVAAAGASTAASSQGVASASPTSTVPLSEASKLDASAQSAPASASGATAQQPAITAPTSPQPAYADNPVKPIVPSAQGQNQSASEDSKKLPTAAIIGIAAAVVAIIAIIAIVLVLGGKDSDEPSDAASSSAATTESGSASSSAEDSADPGVHKVMLETGGGTQYKTMSVNTGDVVTTPKDPTRKGFKFLGWYKDEACTKPIEFPYVVEADDPEKMIIYARWKRIDDSSTRNDDDDDDNDNYKSYSSSSIGSVFPHSSSTYLSRSDLYGLSDAEIQRAINEIYARHGYIFQKSMSERRYFESQPWYHGYETSQSVVQSHFNKYENANVKLLSDYRS